MITGNNEELVDKETFEHLWVDLAAKLNDIGPPEHTVVEWKKIWSAHKSYRNRRRSGTVTNLSLRSDKPRKRPRLGNLCCLLLWWFFSCYPSRFATVSKSSVLVFHCNTSDIDDSYFDRDVNVYSQPDDFYAFV